MSAMGGGEDLSSSPDSKASPRPSTANLKAAGSAPGPYSRDLVAMAAREEVMARDLLAMAAREDPYWPDWAHGIDPAPSSANLKAAGSAPDLVAADWEELRLKAAGSGLVAVDSADWDKVTVRSWTDDWEHGVDPAPSSANLKAAGSAPDLVAADWEELRPMAAGSGLVAVHLADWDKVTVRSWTDDWEYIVDLADDWEYSVDLAPSSSNSSTTKGKVSGSSVYLAVAPSPLLASGEGSYSYGSPRYALWGAARGLAGLDYSWRPSREKVRSRARRRYLAPSQLLPSGVGSYSYGSRVDSFSEPSLPDTMPGTVLSSGYLAPSPLLPSGVGSYSYGSRVDSFFEPILPDTMPGTVLSSGYLAPSPLLPSGEGSYSYGSRLESFSEPSLPDTVPGTVLLPSFEKSEEALDKGYVYFKYLVEKFIAMAYPQGMNGAVATGPGQQEDTTIPSASARSMETETARKVTELEGAGSGKSVIRSIVTHERWTWKNQRTCDGPHALIVLPPTIKQIIKDSCTPTATKAVLESNLRVQHNENSVLSLVHLNKLYKDSTAKHPDEQAIRRMFSIVESEGVLSETDFKNPQNAGAARYHITKFRDYTVDRAEYMKYALLKLREGGPLMGVIRISKNYNQCAVNGEIYKYDPNQEFEEDGKPKKITHAICIISFGIQGQPYLEGHNSYEEKFKPYLKIDVSSLCQLWSIECERRGRIQGAGRYPLPGVRRTPQVPLGSESAVPGKNTTVLSIPGSSDRFSASARMERLPSRWPQPVWHAPWKNYRVISGHLGWVRSIAFDPGNEWFCTGSADRTIKMWDLASGTLKLTLTGHIEQVRGLAVSQRHTYLFSAGDDKQVKCWDLEQNKVIRSYQGHLSGVYCLALHPTIDVLLTGGRDSVCKVWDIRTKAHVSALTGHDNTVCSVFARPTDPQVVTGSHDTTIKLWDLAAGKTMCTLRHHKKSVRAMAPHPKEKLFASASADNIKKFSLPKGEFLHNMLSQQKTILNAMAVNEDGVLATAGDNGSMWFCDWKSGHNFQQERTIVQRGSLESQACIYALSYDNSGSRLVTCEADKTVKMWKEDLSATPETHPVNFKPPKDIRRY